MDISKFFPSTFINLSGSAINLSEIPDTHELPMTGYLLDKRDDFEEYVDLHDLLFDAEFENEVFKISGDSMIDAGLFDGDLAIVEKGKKPGIDDLVIVTTGTSYLIKYLKQDKSGRFFLKSANKKYKNIYLKKSIKIFGVVSSVIRKFK